MAKIVGIDIRDTHVRAVLLRTQLRGVELEQLAEVEVAAAGGTLEALKQVILPMVQAGEHFAVAIDGQKSFIHNITLPHTALKQLSDVLPFELEAELPVPLDEVVYDFRPPRRVDETSAKVLTASARENDVSEVIRLVKEASSKEPERVSCGALPLANLVELAPAVLGSRVLAVVDFAGARTDFVVLEQGAPVFARTLSRGVNSLPDGAAVLAAELRQSLAAWLAKGGQGVEAVYLTGSLAPGATEYLAYYLGLPVEVLPELTFKELAEEKKQLVPRYARAIGIALGLRSKAQDLNLRQAGLKVGTGFNFIKEKAPVLSGLAITIFVFFLFATWAEMRGLSRDNEVLGEALSKLSLQVLGEETADPERVSELINKGPGSKDNDPMPHMDAFDVIVEISKVVPLTVTHDIEEFDMQRNKVKVNGVVGATDEAQGIASALGEHACFHNVKVSKVTQVVNSDRQKYSMEFDVACPEDGGAKKTAAAKTSEGAAP